MKFDRKLLRRIAGIRFFLFLTIAISAAIGGCIIAQAYFVAHIVNNVFLGHQSLTLLAPLLFAFIVVIVARALLLWGSDIASFRIAGRAKIQLRRQLYERLLALGPAYIGLAMWFFLGAFAPMLALLFMLFFLLTGVGVPFIC